MVYKVITEEKTRENARSNVIMGTYESQEIY